MIPLAMATWLVLPSSWTGLMHTLGLHGKSFMPMLIGFCCTVPTVYATRTLENGDDRVLTGMLAPMMICGA